MSHRFNKQDSGYRGMGDWTAKARQTNRKSRGGRQAEAEVLTKGKGAQMRLDIYTDGACEPNPGQGGWGFVVIVRGMKFFENFDGHHSTTNNRMEMTAVLEALRYCEDGSRPAIHSDSQYVVKGMTIWAHGWRRKGYMRKPGIEMPNADLWKAMHRENDRVQAALKWVRGHSGIEFNEYADRLAAKGRQLAMGRAA